MTPAAGQRKLSHVIGADGSLLTLDDLPPITKERCVVRLYEFFLLAEGQVMQKLEFECTDDAKAIDEAHRLAADHTVEIYCGYRLVGSLVAGKAHPGLEKERGRNVGSSRKRTLNVHAHCRARGLPTVSWTGVGLKVRHVQMPRS